MITRVIYWRDLADVVYLSSILHMSLLRHPAADKLRVRLWHCVLIFAVCVLAANVATRYCNGSSSPTVKSVLRHSAPDAKQQHLDKDAVRWAAPAQRFALLDAPTLYPRIALAVPPPRDLLFEDSLYIRPPPLNSSSFQFRS
jgi:hypothetical protein